MALDDPFKEDIGHDHAILFLRFAPDRALNPQYKDIPDCDKAIIHIDHPRADGQGGMCVSAAILSVAPEVLKGGAPTWDVESWEPLTLSPSLLCRNCGDHGFIREGRWVPA